MSTPREMPLSSLIKQQILSDLSKEGAVVADIARKYNVPAKRLYAWRSQHTKRVCDAAC